MFKCKVRQIMEVTLPEGGLNVPQVSDALILHLRGSFMQSLDGLVRFDTSPPKKLQNGS